MTTITLNTGTGTQQWTPPAGCYTIDKIELWGAGGSGSRYSSRRVTGGGGGAYTFAAGPIDITAILTTPNSPFAADFSITFGPSNTMPYFLGVGGTAVASNLAGNNGSATWVISSATYIADFGRGGANATSGTVAGGPGGLIANCIPSANAFAGGAGGTCSSASGASGGGSSATSITTGGAGLAVTTAAAGNGGSASGGGAGGGAHTAGTSNAAGGGGGGGSITAANAGAGGAPGGGGGACNGSTNSSGAGAAGQIVLTYTPGRWVGGAATSGSGTWNADATVLKGANYWDGGVYTFSPSGLFAGAAATIDAGSAILSGNGLFAAIGSHTPAASTALTGSGGLIASPVGQLQASSALFGAGAWVASAIHTPTATGTLGGAGNLSAATTTAQESASTSAAGAGLFTGGASTMRTAVTAPMSGGSSFAAVAAQLYSGAASLSGVGTFIGSVSQTASATASLSAIGQWTAIAAHTPIAAGTFGGSSGVVATPSGIELASAALSGVGSLTAIPSVNTKPGSGEFDGSGFFTTSAVPPIAAPVTPLHYGAGNFSAPPSMGFNLIDISSPGTLPYIPPGTQALVYLGYDLGNDATFRALVAPYIGQPNIWGFYLADEPTDISQGGTATAAGLRAESDYIHANFPGAYTFIVCYNNGTPPNPSYSFGQSNTGIDYLGLDPYPIRPASAGYGFNPNGYDFSVIGAAVTAGIAAGTPLANLVPVYQAFGGGGYPSWTLPTPAQIYTIFSTWAGLLPTPAFDYVYAWNQQLGDFALVNSPQIATVYAAHNTGMGAAPYVQAVAGGTLSGAGGFSASGTHTPTGSSVSSGSGSFAGGTVQSISAAASLAGTSSLIGNTTHTPIGAGSFAGTGAITEADVQRQAASGSCSGAGSFYAYGLVAGSSNLWSGSATLSGSGGIVGYTTTIDAASAAFQGISSLTATAITGTTGSANLVGSGSWGSATASIYRPTNAAISGIGGFSSVLNTLNVYGTPTLMVGSGGFAADGSRLSGATAICLGSGVLQAVFANAVLAASAGVLVGSGLYASQGIHTPIGSATMGGGGVFSGEAVGSTISLVSLVGSGSFSGLAVHMPSGNAILTGLGLFVPSATQQQAIATAVVSGLGGFVGHGELGPASANLAGSGTFTVGPTSIINAAQASLSGVSGASAKATQIASVLSGLSGQGAIIAIGTEIQIAKGDDVSGSGLLFAMPSAILQITSMISGAGDFEGVATVSSHAELTSFRASSGNHGSAHMSFASPAQTVVPGPYGPRTVTFGNRRVARVS